MYHNEWTFDQFWENNKDWYENQGITKEQFSEFNHRKGLNKGDMILVIEKENYKVGDVIIFETDGETKYPLIHRLVSLNPLNTKGDNNAGHLPRGIEEDISEETIIGKATLRVPYVGWARLIFYEPFRPENERGFCN
jgi:hypothetical protein